MKNPGRLLKNLIRRLKITAKRSERRRKKQPPRPRIETALLVGMLAGFILPSVIGHSLFFNWLLVACLACYVASAGVLWTQKVKGEGRRFFLRLAAAIVLVVGPLVGLGVVSYFKVFSFLPQQIETDAYVKDHSEAMARNVEHFVALHEQGKLKSDELGSEHVFPDLGIVGFSMFRAPLIVKSWLGDLSAEDARRHDLWHLAEASAMWPVVPKDIKADALPKDATHPAILMLTCMETRSGHVSAAPIFRGIPSNETERPDFRAFPVVEGIEPDTLGQIQAPIALYGFDASSLDFMAPLGDVCREMKPSAATAE
jgi:hypothetical protein